MRFTCRAMISLLFKPFSLLSLYALCAVTLSTCSVLVGLLLTHISAWLWSSVFYMNNIFFFLFHSTFSIVKIMLSQLKIKAKNKLSQLLVLSLYNKKLTAQLIIIIFFTVQHTEIAWDVIYESPPPIWISVKRQCRLDSWWIQAVEEMLNIFMGIPGPKWNQRSETTSRLKRTGWSPTSAMQKTPPLQQGQRMCEHSCVK